MPSPSALLQRLRSPRSVLARGPACDGQVIVLHDLLGLAARVPKFVRRYAELGSAATEALAVVLVALQPTPERPFPDAQQFRRFQLPELRGFITAQISRNLIIRTP